jgi:hypothetical protein
MNDLDVNILVQTFNERLASLITEVVIKEATIKQLKGEMEKMMEVPSESVDLFESTLRTVKSILIGL